MHRGLGLTVAVVLVMLGMASTARAQAITVGNWNYVGTNPNNNNMPTVAPVGTYTVPAPAAGVTEQWKIVVDSGVLTNGSFAPDQSMAPGAKPLLINNLNNNGTYSFATDLAGNPVLLPFQVTEANLPDNAAVRIRLQKRQANGDYADQGSPAYFAIPAKIKVGMGGGS